VLERDMEQTIVAACRLLGYRVAHFRPARTTPGWRTPMTGDVGFPDLICARPGRVFALELKAKGGRLRDGQADWLRALDGGLVEAQLVYPVDLDDVLALLAQPEAPAT
jgi:hypothetical protein